MALHEELLDLQIPGRVQLSPNTEQVVYDTSLCLGHKTGEHAVGTLWLAQTHKAKSSHQLTPGLFKDRDPQWHPDGKSIAFLSDRSKAGDSCAIYSLPIVGGGEAFALTRAENQKEISVHKFSPDGKFIAFVSADEKTKEQKDKDEAKDDPMVWGEQWPYARLRLLEVATKKITTLAERDAHVLGHLDWSPDGTKIVFAETKTPDEESQCWYGSKISIVDIGTKEITEVCAFPRTTSSLTWAETSLYFIAGVDVENTITADMVWRVKLDSSPHKAERFAHGETDCASSLLRSGRSVGIHVYSGVENHLGLLDDHTLYKVNKEIAAWDVGHASQSDQLVLALVQHDCGTPPEVYSYSPSGGDLVQLSNHGTMIALKHLGHATFLTCKSADGKVDLDITYLRPGKREKADNKPLPTVVHSHGGPYWRDTDSFNPGLHMTTGLLLGAGYGILLPSYRGGSSHGNDFTKALRAIGGTIDYDDVIACTQHAITQGYADKDRLIAAGWSQGGFLTYLLTVRNGLHGHGWKFKGAIPGAGVSDGDTMAFTSDYAAFQDDLAANPPWKSNKDDVSGRVGSAIWEFNAAVEKGDVIPPVLILHGEKDERVPLEQAKAFRRAMESANLPFEMVVYPREPHVLSERKHMLDMGKRILKFVDEHLGHPY